MPCSSEVLRLLTKLRCSVPCVVVYCAQRLVSDVHTSGTPWSWTIVDVLHDSLLSLTQHTHSKQHRSAAARRYCMYTWRSRHVNVEESPMRAVLHNSACVYRSMHMHMRTCTCTAHAHAHAHACACDGEGNIMLGEGGRFSNWRRHSDRPRVLSRLHSAGAQRRGLPAA